MRARARNAAAAALDAALRHPTETREGRIALIGEAAAALLAEHTPSREAAIYLGSALLAWLEHGGRLERDYLRVLKPRSKRTVARVWAEMHDLNSDGSEIDEQE